MDPIDGHIGVIACLRVFFFYHQQPGSEMCCKRYHDLKNRLNVKSQEARSPFKKKVRSPIHEYLTFIYRKSELTQPNLLFGGTLMVALITESLGFDQDAQDVMVLFDEWLAVLGLCSVRVLDEPSAGRDACMS